MPTQLAASKIVLKVRRKSIAALRRAYFAHASEAAARYHVSFDRIVQHLWEARRRNPHLRLRMATAIEDLVHAIACIDGVGLAWADLSARFERPLIRRCRESQDEISATILVRRMFVDLRKTSCGHGSLLLPSLRGYLGDRPLQHWLQDRISVIQTRAALEQVRRGPRGSRPRTQSNSRAPWWTSEPAAPFLSA
jgi:hypothetical protein